MSYIIALVCEGPTDQRVVAALTNRQIEESVDWAQGQINEIVSWRGYEFGATFLAWRDVKRLAKSRNEPVTRKQFGDRLPESEEAFTARKALMLFDRLAEAERPDAVILQRDEDRDRIRKPDLEIARANIRWPFAVAIGVARPMIESWILAGFVIDATAPQEQAILDGLGQHLGFDPCRCGELLSPRHGDLSKQPHKVLETLTHGEYQRERSCYEATSLEILAANGKNNGLAHFFDELRIHVIPTVFGIHQ